MTENSSSEYPNLAQYGLKSLDGQISDHQKTDDSRSVLSMAVSQLWRDDSTLADLKQLSDKAHAAQKSGDTAEFQRLQKQFGAKIDADRESLDSTNEFTHYGSGLLKTTALFVGGKQLLAKSGAVGLAATVTLYGLDRASLSDGDKFAGKLALGGLEGGLTKAAFHGMEYFKIQSIAGKGVLLGFASRGISTGVDSALDPKTTGFLQGSNKVLDTVFDGRAIGTDILLFTAAHGLAKGGNWLSGGALEARPMYNTVATSSSFGLANGWHAEETRQREAHEAVDYTKLFKRAVLQGGLDAVAGIPGGLVADSAFRKRPIATLAEDGRTVLNNAGLLAERLQNKGEGVVRSFEDMITPQRPQLAFAMIDAPESRIRTNTGPVVPDRVYMAMTLPELGGGGEVRGTGAPTEARPAVPEAPRETLKVERIEPPKPGIERPVLAPEVANPVHELRQPERQLSVEERVVTMLMDPFVKGTNDYIATLALYEYIAGHPGVDKYVADLYKENFGNIGVRKAVEGFYKPIIGVHNEPLLQNPIARQELQKLYTWLQDPNSVLAPAKMADVFRQHIDRAKKNGVDITPAIEHYGRTTHVLVAAKAVDLLLNTRYAPLLETFGGPTKIRSLPLEPGDLNAVRVATVVEEAVAQGHQRLPDTQVGIGKDGKPEYVTDTGERVSEDVVKRAAAKRDIAVADAVTRMGSTEPEVKRLAVVELSRQLDHPSSKEWFAAWRTEAAKMPSVGGLLSSEGVCALGDNAVRDFLTADWPNSAPVAGRNSIEQFRNKVFLLSDICVQFIDVSPDGPATGIDIATKLIEASKTDPQSVKNITDKVKHGGGDTYRDWVAQEIAKDVPVKSLVSDDSVPKASIYTAFKYEPDVAKALIEMGASDPKFLEALTFKLSHKMLGDQIRDTIVQRVRDGSATSRNLNADFLMGEININKQFGRSPEAAQRLVEFAELDPKGVDDFLRGPFAPARDGKKGPKSKEVSPAEELNKKLSFAWKDTIAALAPQATSLSQLVEVMSLLKGDPTCHASFAAVARYKLTPTDGAVWNQTQQLMTTVATRNLGYMPTRGLSRPSREGSDTRREAPDPSTSRTGSKDSGSPTTPSGQFDDILPVAAPTDGRRPVRPAISRAFAAIETPGVEQSGLTEPAPGSTRNVLEPSTRVPESTTAPVEKTIHETPEVMTATPEKRILELKEKLNGSEVEKTEAVRELVQHLNDPSASEWFDAWRREAPEHLPTGFFLHDAGVAALPSEVLRRALAEPQVASDGKVLPAPSLEARVKVIKDITELFAGEPDTARKLLDSGASQLDSLKEIAFKARHKNYGDAYLDLVKARVATGEVDLAGLGSSTALDEARIRRAFAPESVSEPHLGDIIAAAGARGELDLRVVLDHLNSESHLSDSFRDDVMDTVKAQLISGPIELSKFGRKTYINEQRIQRALGHDPALDGDVDPLGGVDPGVAIAQAASRGELTVAQLDKVLGDLNNSYYGQTYRQVLRGTLAAGGEPAVTAADDYCVTAARAHRAFGQEPTTAEALVNLGNGDADRPVLKQILALPRDRVLERGYLQIMSALTPQATSIQQLSAVMQAVAQKKGEAAFDAAKAIRPVDEAAWLKVKQLINAVSLQDISATQALLPGRESAPSPVQRSDGGSGRPPHAHSGGGGDRGDRSRSSGNRPDSGIQQIFDVGEPEKVDVRGKRDHGKGKDKDAARRNRREAREEEPDDWD